MAFSLLQHWQDTYSPALFDQLEDDFSPEQTEAVIDLGMAAVLTHLVSLGRQQGYAELRRRIMLDEPDGLWENLDQDTLASQIAQTVQSQTAPVQHWLPQIAAQCVLDLRQLIDLGQQSNEDVAELLENQVELLKGQAPDWVYAQAGLPELQGQPATVEPPPADLSESIATLSTLMREAVSQPSAPGAALAGSAATPVDSPAPSKMRWLVLVVAVALLAGMAYLYTRPKAPAGAAPSVPASTTTLPQATPVTDRPSSPQ